MSASRLLRLLVLVLPPLLAVAPAAGAEAAATEAITVYIVRHAEKSDGRAGDPELTRRGRGRARALARALADEPVTHLFCTPRRRTRDTLAPLAADRGLSISEITAVEEQVAALQALPAGAVAVVAGHSNTVPAMVAGLGGEVAGTEPHADGPRLPDAVHDRLLVLILAPAGDGPARLVRLLQLRYGKP